MAKRNKNTFYKDYKFWFSLIAIIISIISLIRVNNVTFEFKEIKADLVETIKLISPNATIENINGVECVIFKSGGKWCSG